MSVSDFISLLGGVALFLFGMSIMGDALKKVAGNQLELVLYNLTSTPIKGVLLGTGVTAVIQSSSATSVMVVGFVNSGMMKVNQAIGIVLGALVSVVRVTHDKAGKPGIGLKLLNGGCQCYLTVIRGTPVMVQLLIMYFVVFATVDPGKLAVAIIAFGINSGAYVAEIFRSGIMSVDPGQMEAGRSLGLSYGQVMSRIIMPQAVKNILPTLNNEFIALVKETAVVGYIALGDLTRGGDQIQVGDNVIVVTLEHGLHDLRDIVEE